jgi:hypothetical protein
MMDLAEIRIVRKVWDGSNWLRIVFNDGVWYWYCYQTDSWSVCESLHFCKEVTLKWQQHCGM